MLPYPESFLLSYDRHIFITHQSQDTDIKSYNFCQKIPEIQQKDVRCVQWIQLPLHLPITEDNFPTISEIFWDPLYEHVWSNWNQVLSHFAEQQFDPREIWIERGDTTQSFWEIFYRDLLNHWEITSTSSTLTPLLFHVYVLAKKCTQVSSRLDFSTRMLRDSLDSLETFTWESPPVICNTNVIRVETIPLVKQPLNYLISDLQSRSIVLTNDEILAVCQYYQRTSEQHAREQHHLSIDPSDIELHMIAQSWSEHCSHKIFAAKITVEEEGSPTVQIDSLYKSYIQKVSYQLLESGRTELLSIFSDNAGIVQFTDSTALCMKVETHNAPTAIAPYKGALTGICGVQRDILGTGLGAQPIFHIGALFFGPLSWVSDEKTPTPFVPPDRVFDHVMHAIGDAGDRTGVPTLGIDIFFDREFAYRPILFCGAGGILPLSKDSPSESIHKQAQLADRIIIVGAKTTVTGTNGATISSKPLEETFADAESSVPEGEPIIARCVTEFLLAARNEGLYTSITDNGAGGLSCSIGEMGRESNGATVYLDGLYEDEDDVPREPSGEIVPWKIFLSEAQDRMTVSVPPEKLSRFVSLSKDYSVRTQDVGEFTNSGYITIYWKQQCIGHISMQFLHTGCPQLQLHATISSPPQITPVQSLPELSLSSLTTIFFQVLSSDNLSSKRNWVRKFDNFVLGQTVIRPFDGPSGYGRSTACVIRPDPQHPECIAVSFAVHPRLGSIDATANAVYAVDTAVRHAVSVGANPQKLYALDNFAWPDPIEGESNPDGRQKLGTLVQTCQSLYAICNAYQIPLISGKDSMKNDFVIHNFKISIPPLLLVSLMGVIPHYRQTTTGFVKKKQSLLYILGETAEHLCGSQLYQTMGIHAGSTPKIHNFSTQMQQYQRVYKGHQSDLFLSCRSIDRGGIAIAMAEFLIGGEKGASMTVPPHMDPYVFLFSETPGRFLLEVDSSHQKAVEDLFRENHLEPIGLVTDLHLEITYREKMLLRQSWQSMQTYWEEFSHTGPRSKWGVL